MRSAFELASPQKTAIEQIVKPLFGEATAIDFETKPDLISGIELTANGQKIAWSIADYLTSLTNSVTGCWSPSSFLLLSLKRPFPMPPDSLLTAVDRAFAGMKQAREVFVPSFSARETGIITTVSTGIATVIGLPGVGFEELIQFPGDLFGIAFNVDEEEIGVVLLGDYSHLQTGDEVRAHRSRDGRGCR